MKIELNNIKQAKLTGNRKFYGLIIFIFSVTWIYSFLGYHSLKAGFPLDTFFWTSVASSYGAAGLGFFGANSVEHITNKKNVKEENSDGNKTN